MEFGWFSSGATRTAFVPFVRLTALTCAFAGDKGIETVP